VNDTMTCPDCDGLGGYMTHCYGPSKCHTCHGRKWVQECDECYGTGTEMVVDELGEVEQQPCEECHGTGVHRSVGYMGDYP